jgi:urease accessory protein
MNAQLHDATETPEQTPWHAELQLQFVARAGRTVLASRKHVGPLVVQRPFYPEGDVCHVYIVHPPGGVVGGDHLHLDAKIEEGAHALITTPAATKFYRSPHQRRAVVHQQLSVQQGILEWLPQEAIYFDQSVVKTRTRIDLHEQSQFIGWELSCYGRLACDENFDQGHIHQSFELWRDGQPLLLDRLQITGNSLMQQAAWGLSGRSALGNLLAYPATPDDVVAVRECGVDASQLSCTLVDGVLVCRCLSVDGMQLKQQLLKVWQCLRPRVIRRDAVLPRIWAT